MDENQQPEQQAVQAVQPSDLEALIALVEERVVENLTRIIERIVQGRGGS